MQRNRRRRAAVLVAVALTAALGALGCSAPKMSGGAAQVPTPLDPANKARAAAGAANNAIKGIQGDVDSSTPGK